MVAVDKVPFLYPFSSNGAPHIIVSVESQDNLVTVVRPLKNCGVQVFVEGLSRFAWVERVHRLKVSIMLGVDCSWAACTIYIWSVSCNESDVGVVFPLTEGGYPAA